MAEDRRSEDVARLLACEAGPADTVYVAGSDYPYELPFYAQLAKPLVVVQDWARQRKEAGDDWRRELFDGADFDARAAQVLQPPRGAGPGRCRAGQLAAGAPRGPDRAAPAGWALVQRGTGFNLYKSGGGAVAGSALERPEAAQHKGLPGCKHQRDK